MDKPTRGGWYNTFKFHPAGWFVFAVLSFLKIPWTLLFRRYNKNNERLL